MRTDENSIAAALIAATHGDDAVQQVKRKRNNRKGGKFNNLSAMQVELKKTQRDSLWMEKESVEHEYSETAQEIKMRKAAEKRARRSGKQCIH